MEQRFVGPDRHSGTVRSYRYDELSQSLEIEFVDGRRCVHTGVPLSIYETFDIHPYPGRFWALGIRHRHDGTFGYPMRMVS